MRRFICLVMVVHMLQQYKMHNFFNGSEIDRVHIVATLLKLFIRNEQISHSIVNYKHYSDIVFMLECKHMNSTQMIHMWEMFEDFERLLIELLTGRLPTDEA